MLLKLFYSLATIFVDTDMPMDLKKRPKREKNEKSKNVDLPHPNFKAYSGVAVIKRV